MTNSETVFNDEELIARLRDCGNGVGSFKTNQGDYGLCDDAADRIAALLDVRDTLRRLLAKQTARAEQLAATNEALVKERDDAVIKRAAWELEAKTQIARAVTVRYTQADIGKIAAIIAEDDPFGVGAAAIAKAGRILAALDVTDMTEPVTHVRTASLTFKSTRKNTDD